ncbi:hypothetical protein BGZ61DRAFT_556629 [Ilyonectria robusta]|uniref:uncharacterized protein n=1 Tax=Ilyonectria robusta TaxID=1079257 RepID=UPI001E8D4597|nr:uncharacterized protein BGZ61DRAFT_556629 [Ilyonectria robusta]KAH8670546.1 hypothetical protein BGZ61DRAFT_556629 [Ilyonectria robusta]
MTVAFWLHLIYKSARYPLSLPSAISIKAGRSRASSQSGGRHACQLCRHMQHRLIKGSWKQGTGEPETADQGAYACICFGLLWATSNAECLVPHCDEPAPSTSLSVTFFFATPILPACIDELLGFVEHAQAASIVVSSLSSHATVRHARRLQPPRAVAISRTRCLSTLKCTTPIWQTPPQPGFGPLSMQLPHASGIDRRQYPRQLSRSARIFPPTSSTLVRPGLRGSSLSPVRC